MNAAKAVESAMPSLSINDVTINEGPARPPSGHIHRDTLRSDGARRDGAVQHRGQHRHRRDELSGEAARSHSLGPHRSAGEYDRHRRGARATVGGFFLRLSNATNATILRSNGRCTIAPLDTDADGMPDYWENHFGFNFDRLDPTDAVRMPTATA